MDKTTADTAKKKTSAKKKIDAVEAKSEAQPVVKDQASKRLAADKNPTMEALLNGSFSFTKKEDALEKLNSIKEHFIVSAKLPKEEENIAVKLWVRGFKIDEEEEKQGFLGNYALIKIEESNKKFNLIVEKQKVALKYHPQRRRPIRKHPDWGHPCMRIIKKGTAFENIESAKKVFTQLQEEYPLVSVATEDKLYIILYSKAYNPPIKKFVLEIKPVEGKFVIEFSENNYIPKPAPIRHKLEEKDKKPRTEKKKIKEKTVESRNSIGDFSNRIFIPKQ